METQADVARNPEAFLQIGDFVAASFFFSSLALLLVAIFLFFQLRSTPKLWRNLLLLATLVPLVASLNGFYRRNYWVLTQTNPVEFRFFDWFLTVPLMAIVFYFLLKPVGAKRGMLWRLGASSALMIGFGYIGEAVYPEQPVMWGILGSLGFALMIASIMAEGYPRIFKAGVAPALRRGYVNLSIFLPLGWSVYPLGYMNVPGNVLEGLLDVNAVAIIYNLADVLNKGGLAIGVYLIIREMQEREQTMVAMQRNATANPLPPHGNVPAQPVSPPKVPQNT